MSERPRSCWIGATIRVIWTRSPFRPRWTSSTQINLRVQASDPGDATVGRAKINGLGPNGLSLCGTKGLRLDPNVIAGSTRFKVHEIVAGASWHVTTEAPEQNIAGCVDAAGDTTYWHVNMDFMVEAPLGG